MAKATRQRLQTTPVRRYDDAGAEPTRARLLVHSAELAVGRVDVDMPVEHGAALAQRRYADDGSDAEPGAGGAQLRFGRGQRSGVEQFGRWRWKPVSASSVQTQPSAPPAAAASSVVSTSARLPSNVQCMRGWPIAQRCAVKRQSRRSGRRAPAAGAPTPTPSHRQPSTHRRASRRGPRPAAGTAPSR